MKKTTEFQAAPKPPTRVEDLSSSTGLSKSPLHGVTSPSFQNRGAPVGLVTRHIGAPHLSGLRTSRHEGETIHT